MNLYSKIKSNKTAKNIIELFFILFMIIAVRTFVFGLYQVPSGSMETTLLVGERFIADKFTIWFKPIKRGEIIAFDDPTYNYSDNFFVNLYQRYLSLSVSNWTKRVIGIPGDHIKGRIENGKPVVYLNEEKLNEPYINKYPLIFIHNKNGNPNDPEAGQIDLRSYDPSKPYNKQPFYNVKPEDIWQWLPTGQPALLHSNTPAKDGLDIFDKKLGKDEYWVMGDNRLNSSDSRVWQILDKKLIHGRIVFRLLSIDSSYSWLIFEIFDPINFLLKKVRWSRCLNWVS